MQESTNDNYTDSPHSILNIRTLNYILIKCTNNYLPDAPFARAASSSFQYGEFENKVNTDIECCRSIGFSPISTQKTILRFGVGKIL